jgi:hypothetical protein
MLSDQVENGHPTREEHDSSQESSYLEYMLSLYYPSSYTISYANWLMFCFFFNIYIYSIQNTPTGLYFSVDKVGAVHVNDI